MDKSIRNTFETDPDLRIAIRAVFIQVRNGELCVLLGLHKKHQKYMFPGGGIEASDLNDWSVIEGTLARELQEELRLRIGDVYPGVLPLSEMTIPAHRVLKCNWENNNKPRVDLCLCFHLPSNYSLPFDPKSLPSESELQSAEWVPFNLNTIEVFGNTRAVLDALPRYLNSETFL